MVCHGEGEEVGEELAVSAVGEAPLTEALRDQPVDNAQEQLPDPLVTGLPVIVVHAFIY